ncbi:MAG: DUF1570 domain-containing protein [Candidatus Brocadiae bacterium]|nr:DUF1570 domain-containing protein [Candidatus Brocadiia bacterium]
MLSALLALSILACPPPGIEHKTAHYDLYAETVDPEEIGALLEEAWKQFARFFLAAPKDRLRVEIYASNEAYQAALKRDKQGEIHSGGYYSPGTKIAYLWVQPSDYFTRQLILHEAAHQFHYLAATENKNTTAPWYAEGIAEYLGMHNWDGKTLKTGVVPAVSLEDYPAKALEQYEAIQEDLQAAATGTVAADRPLAWAIVHWSVNRRPREWAAFAADMNRGRPVRKSWEKAMGDMTPAWKKDFRDWLESHQQPLRIVWINWQERGELIEGRAAPGVIAGAVLKKPGPRLAVEIVSRDGANSAGLMFHHAGKEDYWLLDILDGSQASIRHRLNGQWESRGAVKFEKRAGAPTAELVRDGSASILKVNGTEIGRVEGSGEAGPAFEGGRVVFRLLK